LVAAAGVNDVTVHLTITHTSRLAAPEFYSFILVIGLVELEILSLHRVSRKTVPVVDRGPVSVDQQNIRRRAPSPAGGSWRAHMRSQSAGSRQLRAS